EQERAYKEKFIGFAGMMQPDESFFTGAERLKPAQEIKKEFNLKKMPEKAVLYATAHGVYKAYINGNAVSDTRLAPETTRYDKLLYYQTYDITALIKEGENVLNVTVADGWWIGRVGLAGDSCNYGDMLGFLGQLEFTYADGHKEIIASDKSFVSRESYIRYSDLYIGEKRDETFVFGPWIPCKETEYDNSVLMAQPADPIRVIDEVNVKEYICTPEGDLVLDFGQVLTGVLNIEFTGKKGSEISLEHAEVLDINGNFKNNIIGRCKDQKDIIICGDNTESFCPEFTYHGFRYVRVKGLNKDRIKSAKALVIGTPVKKLASFSTDNDDINRLQSCIEWSTVTNMTGVPTDCPQREKLGWTGDIRVFGDTGCFLYDLRNILGNWLYQMRLDQYADGQIPVVIPNHPSQEMLQMEMSG
ncbi:MAG: family 78 glycoside hydrolase catalytic domain, partial [Parasporobacterium sp.]|nr:family 78 glycoside hydrolase catalytic domain [Parasporobacterium sp.]